MICCWRWTCGGKRPLVVFNESVVSEVFRLVKFNFHVGLILHLMFSLDPFVDETASYKATSFPDQERFFNC